MTRPLFNPILLESPDGCDQAIRELGVLKQAVHNRVQALRSTQQRRPLQPVEQEELDALEDRFRLIANARGDCKQRKRALVESTHRQYGQAFIDAAKEVLDPALVTTIHAKACEIVEADDALRSARRAIGSVGSAIPMHGSVAPGLSRRTL